MLDFANAACKEPVAFEPPIGVPDDFWQAVDWVNERRSEDIIAEREAAMCAIEAEAAKLSSSGAIEQWMQGAEPGVRAVASEVNGPLLETLANRTGFGDASCVEFFRAGAPVAGPLPVSGSGEPTPRASALPVSSILESAGDCNRSLLQSLREDKNSSSLLRLTLQEVKLGRVSAPCLAENTVLDNIVVSPRFGVEKQKPDGSIGIRAVDDLSRSGVNSCTSVGEKFRPEGIDPLYHGARSLASATEEPIEFFKADIDAAFRRLPAAPAHRIFLYFAFIVQGAVHIACHRAMPFGAVASVHAWERLGALLSHLVRRLLHIPLLRFVDDLFGAERRRCARHALGCVVRLVRCLLGESAIAAGKTAVSMPLVVLGLQVSANSGGFTCLPSPDKVRKWTLRIEAALVSGNLRPGDASKLAGALRWACSGMFKRLGRVFVRPLYNHAKQGRCGLGPHLREALEWWREVLALGLSETRSWELDARPPAQLFVDARSTPPRLAAVLFLPEGVFYSDWEPPCVCAHFL